MESSDRPVDLRSDTVTRPTPAMREAMMGAPVGDDVLGKDPTVNELEHRTAEILGKEAALFFPSGTQANQTAVALHTQPGEEIICESRAHIYQSEMSDPAWLSGVQVRPVDSRRGRISTDTLESALREGDRWTPRTGMIGLENPHNWHGGVLLSPSDTESVYEFARDRGLPVHLDGARLWNAVAASDREAEAFAHRSDTVMVSLSKGLGCPVGSLLAGTESMIERGWSLRKRLGGGMRQVGILAAAGLYALDHHRTRLVEDHRRARELAGGFDSISGVTCDPPDTNIVIAELPRGTPTASVVESLENRGVRVLPFGADRIRAVTHLDVDDHDLQRAIPIIQDTVAAAL